MLLANIDQGNGPALVLLHSYCQDKLIWEDMGIILEKEFRTIRVDLPGHGDSPCFPEHSQPSIDDYADAVIETLDFLSIERFLLVGYSLGGYIAASLCEKIPHRIMGVCMLHSSFLPETKERKDAIDQIPYYLRKVGVETMVLSTLASYMGHKTGAFSNTPLAFAGHLPPEQLTTLQTLIARSIHMSPTGIIQGAFALKNRPNRRELLGQLPFPLRFIAGKQDKLLPMSDAILQSGLPKDGQLHVIEGVSHLGPLEAFQKVLLSIQCFCQYCLAVEEGRYQ